MDQFDPTEELLKRVHIGDEQALHQLLERDLKWIQEQAHRCLGDSGLVRGHEQTGDVVNDVVVRLLRHGPRFLLASRNQFRALLAKMVVNQVNSRATALLTSKRDAKRERPGVSDSVLWIGRDAPRDSVIRPEQDAAAAEAREWIRLGMTLVDPDDHDILVLREWDQLQFSEIGERLGLTEDAARMRHLRALRRLELVVLILKSGRVEDLLGELLEPDHETES